MSERRLRGRPVGGGNTAEQARTLLMDAAEQLFITRGFRSSTMEVIARQAGYSRTAIYRHFPTRRHLLEAMVQRTTGRYMSSIVERVPGSGPMELLVESLIIVCTELPQDPLLATISEQSPDGTIASMIADDPGLTQLVESVIESMVADDPALFRQGLHPYDIAQFIIATALGMLLQVVPGLTDSRVARTYIETFVLPAIVARPPAPSRTFRRADDASTTLNP